jgi:hypothetical protein
MTDSIVSPIRRRWVIILGALLLLPMALSLEGSSPRAVQDPTSLDCIDDPEIQCFSKCNYNGWCVQGSAACGQYYWGCAEWESWRCCIIAAHF